MDRHSPSERAVHPDARGTRKRDLGADHALITSKVHFVWGADDQTFPVSLARSMLTQLPHASLVEIPGAKLLPHEEKPDEVAREILSFFAGSVHT